MPAVFPSEVEERIAERIEGRMRETDLLQFPRVTQVYHNAALVPLPI